MGQASGFVISSSAEENCRAITVYDQTDYTAFGHLREDCGIALFWSKDAFVLDVDGDLSNSTEGWVFPSDTGNTYTIRAYIVPVWDSLHGAYAANSIVYHNLNFYHGSGVKEPGALDGSPWVVLDEDDHTTFETHLYTGAIDYGYTEILEELTCDKYTLSKTACYEYELSFAASLVARTITITKYDGTVLDPAYTDTIAIADTTIDIDLTSYEDGVYLLTIIESGEPNYNIVIYEICTLISCGTSLLDSLFQTDVDPCCEDCDDDISEVMWKQRHDLNQMIFYLAYVLAYINVDSIEYLGVFDISTDRQTMINRVGDYVDKLLVIADRCGLCD